jgi:hypothetical protein
MSPDVLRGRGTCSPWVFCQDIDLEDFAEWWPSVCLRLPCCAGVAAYERACFQLDEPALHDAEGRALVGPPFEFPESGARPFWPLHDIGWSYDAYPPGIVRERMRADWLKRWPHLCTGWEVLPTATYDGQAALGLCRVKP